MKKAQVFSLDILLALIGFIVVIGITMYFYGTISTQYKKIDLKTDVVKVGQYAYQVLFESQGNPHDWHTKDFATQNTSTIRSLGVATFNPAILNPDKLAKLSAENDTYYNEIKRYVGYLGPKYDFYYTVTMYDNVAGQYQANPAYKFGKTVNSKTFVHKITSYVEINNTIARVYFWVYVNDG